MRTARISPLPSLTRMAELPTACNAMTARYWWVDQVNCQFTKASTFGFRHPLNCEPPMPMLMEKGFITPVSLHYVRNHGAVPKLDWDSHRVHVTGMVDNPMTFSVPELISLLPSYTIPVTLVCAGNPPSLHHSLMTPQ